MDRFDARATIERLHAAQNAMYAGGDVEPVRALLTDDVEWHGPGENAIAGVYRGIDEVVEYFDRRRAIAANTLRLHPGEILVGEDQHIAVLTGGSASLGGAECRWSTLGLDRLRGRRIAPCWLLPLEPGGVRSRMVASARRRGRLSARQEMMTATAAASRRRRRGGSKALR